MQGRYFLEEVRSYVYAPIALKTRFTFWFLQGVQQKGIPIPKECVQSGLKSKRSLARLCKLHLTSNSQLQHFSLLVSFVLKSSPYVTFHTLTGQKVDLNRADVEWPSPLRRTIILFSLLSSTETTPVCRHPTIRSHHHNLPVTHPSPIPDDKAGSMLEGCVCEPGWAHVSPLRRWKSWVWFSQWTSQLETSERQPPDV